MGADNADIYPAEIEILIEAMKSIGGAKIQANQILLRFRIIRLI